MFAIVPSAATSTTATRRRRQLFGHETYLQLADPPIGILFAAGHVVDRVYGVMLAGWSSGSKYPLLGSVRATAQMVSYEAALGCRSWRSSRFAAALHPRHRRRPGRRGLRRVVPNWNLLAHRRRAVRDLLIAATAELNRPPFDLVEAEQELVGGFHTEYSSIRFALFFLAEFMNTGHHVGDHRHLFLGGPAGPVVRARLDLGPIVWFFAKLIVFLFMFVWFRATLPRFRYDQLMDLGWKVLIPLSLGWLLLLAAIRTSGATRAGTSPVIVGSRGVRSLAAGLLSRPLKVGPPAPEELEEVS
jgi:NADH-quinone oxidoreductase subunit H